MKKKWINHAALSTAQQTAPDPLHRQGYIVFYEFWSTATLLTPPKPHRRAQRQRTLCVHVEDLGPWDLRINAQCSAPLTGSGAKIAVRVGGDRLGKTEALAAFCASFSKVQTGREQILPVQSGCFLKVKDWVIGLLMGRICFIHKGKIRNREKVSQIEAGALLRFAVLQERRLNLSPAMPERYLQDPSCLLQCPSACRKPGHEICPCGYGQGWRGDERGMPHSLQFAPIALQKPSNSRWS